MKLNGEDVKKIAEENYFRSIDKKWRFSIEKKIGERRKVKKRGVGLKKKELGNKTGIKKTEKNRM